MKANRSPLVLNNFLLLNHKYQFIQPVADSNNIEVFDQYLIDIDYVIKGEDEGFFQMFTKIDINNIDKPLPGYKLFIEGVCIFSFEKNAGLTDKDKASLLHISGINISVNSLRNILSYVTANGPFGKYILPAIDVNKILEDKKQILEHKKKNK
jgi:hypothetical protein